jgi:hypothetical protein
MLATGLFLLLCVGIAVLGLAAPRRPRLVSLLFLIVAAFVLTNKVYSPQYSLWLVPLAVMARPRWRDFLIWQAGEVVYFAAIWWFLVGYGVDDATGTDPARPTRLAIVDPRGGDRSTWSSMVLQDMLSARSRCRCAGDGFEEDRDDPGGGVVRRRAGPTSSRLAWREARRPSNRDATLVSPRLEAEDRVEADVM